MSPLGISLLRLLAVAGFSLLAWRKLQIVMALQPQPRWDHPWQRLRSVLVNGLFQRRMVQREWKPGLILTIMLTDFAFEAFRFDKLMEATDEADMKAGVRDARDLVWKDGLDAFTCTSCGYCEAACPIELEHLDKFFRMRQHQVMIAGEFPHELKKVFEAYESQGNPWGLQASQRGDWAAGLNVPVVRSARDMAGLDCLFYVGSSPTSMRRARCCANCAATHRWR